MRRWSRIFLSVIALAATAAYADTLNLKNGDVLTGTLSGLHNGTFVFVSELIAQINVPQSAVASILTELEFEIRYADGRVVRSPLATHSVLADMVSIEPVRDRSTMEWSTNLNASLSLSLGNNDTSTYLLGGQSSVAGEKTKHTVSTVLIKDSANNQTIRSHQDTKYQFRRFFTSDWFAAANIDYFRDPIKGVDQRLGVGAGLGRTFLQTPVSALSSVLGFNHIFEDIQMTSEQSTGVRLFTEFSRNFMGGKLKALHRHRLLYLPWSDSGVVVDSSNSLRYPIANQFNLDVRTEIQHETTAAPGRKKTDVTYAVGIGTEF